MMATRGYTLALTSHVNVVGLSRDFISGESINSDEPGFEMVWKAYDIVLGSAPVNFIRQFRCWTCNVLIL